MPPRGTHDEPVHRLDRHDQRGVHTDAQGQVGRGDRRCRAAGQLHDEARQLASIVVSVFGTGKVEQLKQRVGEPMAFCNLWVVCAGRGSAPQINHYSGELMESAPEYAKTATLRARQQDLAAATNTEKLTAVWTPNLARDVTGRQALSCATFVDYTTETPEAALPEVVQLMCGHIEELDLDGEVLDPSGIHIWYRVGLRDRTGSVLLGIPQRCVLILAGCATKEETCHSSATRASPEAFGPKTAVLSLSHT